jgi:TolB protein
MPEYTDKQSSVVVVFNVGRRKIITVLVLAMILISGLFILPAAMAQEDAVAFLPAVFSPPPPGSTGRLVFTVNSGVDREIYTMNPDGSDRQRLTDNEAVDDMPSWSADSALIAFTSDRRAAGNFEIYVMNVDGSDQVRLTSSQWDDNHPSFSPDGDQIVFATDRNVLFQVFVMDSDGSGQTALTGDSYSSGSPEWSPDGTKIAYSSDQPGNLEVYVMDADGSNKVRLTNSSAPDFSPAWSPDGERIVFTSMRDGDRRIYVMDADGSDEKRLTDFYSDWADWSPDGTRIVFTRRHDALAATLTRNNDILSSDNAGRSGRMDVGQYFAPHGAAQESDLDLYTMKPDGSDKQPLTQTADEREDRANWGN